ncbi:ankyrin repeat domain-containing protein [Chamaesiphon minutus]|uniref:Ankyrin repeat-containing protein n=1 Tax=Chamaesiphon minutus (strain ATCC 27169 / PCC 6605) TaxID=1173020 RepID=K9UGW3_CHAP6|nr:ankyrin repeat domain-containing protein [Chamaesiphon minutus]AFY94342.1 ankyrin repeat-containing protein [Chamaesiphon minutus PCC 6605]
MSESTVFKICLVITAHLVLISHPTFAAILTGAHIAIESNERLATPNNLYLTQSTSEQGKEIEDPIFEDVVSNRIEKLKQFLNSGGSPNRYFHAAINAGAIDSVKVMLERGANVNLAGEEGVTPLMTAARVTYRGGLEMTELLIKKGANVNAKASKGSTALMYASWGVADHYQDEYVKVVRLLIKNGAKVNVKNKIGDTPLSIARKGKWQKIVIALQKAGAKV